MIKPLVIWTTGTIGSSGCNQWFTSRLQWLTSHVDCYCWSWSSKIAVDIHASIGVNQHVKSLVELMRQHNDWCYTIIIINKSEPCLAINHHCNHYEPLLTVIQSQWSINHWSTIHINHCQPLHTTTNHSIPSDTGKFMVTIPPSMIPFTNHCSARTIIIPYQ